MHFIFVRKPLRTKNYENIMHTKLFWIYSIVFVATVSSQSEIGERNALAMSLLKVSEFTGNRKYVVSNYVEIYFLFNCRF